MTMVLICAGWLVSVAPKLDVNPSVNILSLGFGEDHFRSQLTKRILARPNEVQDGNEQGTPG